MIVVGEADMGTQATEPRTEQLVFEPPGSGSWQLEATHWPRPVTRLMQSHVYREPFARGFTEGMRRYGLAILCPELQFVNGFVYSTVRPAPEHELPERFTNAARAFETRLWREDMHRWDEEVKPASIRAHLALQRIDPWSLDGDALVGHLEECRQHLERMFEQHHRFTAPALVPTGDFLVQASELSGVPPAELLPLLRGSAPVSAGAEDGLEALADALRADGEAVAILESDERPAGVLAALRQRSGAVGAAATKYLDMVECRLLDGFDVGYPCGFELPGVLVKAIRGAIARDGGDVPADEEATQRIRERVPQSERSTFDELLAEARHTYRLRDERSIYSDVWALGLMRRAILAAGGELAAAGRIEEPAHLVEAEFEEIVSLVRDRRGPSAEELRSRARFRAMHSAAAAPPLLGDPPAPPPLEGLPEATARVMRAVGLYLGLLFGESDAESEERVVRGLAASPGIYQGSARLLAGPEDVGLLRQGDVLVTGSTSEAFNVVLPLVGAIVTDSGGLLSHAAIVAREYGIPGVVGTRAATRLIEDGARVRVDGDSGEVVVLS